MTNANPTRGATAATRDAAPDSVTRWLEAVALLTGVALGREEP